MWSRAGKGATSRRARWPDNNTRNSDWRDMPSNIARRRAANNHLAWRRDIRAG